MFAKEIILKEQLAARCLFQCSVDRELRDNAGTLDYGRFAGYPPATESDLYCGTLVPLI